MDINKIITEEVQNMLEASMTKNFRKAIESLQDIQLKQQQLQKAFVAEKNVKKKEKLKQALIKMHKVVQKAEMEFDQALRSEPVELEEAKLTNDKLMNLIPKMPKGYVGKNTRTGEYTISTPDGEDIVLTRSKDKKNWSYEPSNIALKILDESVTEAKDNLYLQLHKKYAIQIKGLKAKKIKKLTDLVSVQRYSMEDREDYFDMDSKKKKELSKQYDLERKLF